MKTLAGPEAVKPQERSRIEYPTRAVEVFRLRHFVTNGFTAFENSKAIHYKVTMSEGTDIEELFTFLRSKTAEIPCIVIGVAGNETLRLFRIAQGAGLVTLNVSHTSDVPPQNEYK